jgi:single-strand DNA-binding protein
MTRRVVTTARSAGRIDGAFTGTSGAGEHLNEVRLCGRLAAVAAQRQLPSGDVIVTWRLVVERDPAAAPRKVDVIDCTAYAARLRRQALGWKDGDLIEIAGALRRRFWRGAGGVQSRCDVEVATALRRGSIRGVNRGERAVATPLSRRRRP